MRSLRGVLALGSSQKSPQLPFLDEAGKKYCAEIHLALYAFARTHISLFSLLNILLCRDLKYKEVSYLPITVLTQERLRAAVVWWDFFFFLSFGCAAICSSFCSVVLLRLHTYLFVRHTHLLETLKSTSLPLVEISTKLPVAEAHSAWWTIGISKVAYTCFCFQGEKWIANYCIHIQTWHFMWQKPALCWAPNYEPAVLKKGCVGEEENREGPPSLIH